MQYIEQLLFVIILGVALYFFVKKIKQIRRNIFLGKDETINDQKAERWKIMTKVALGQSKMVVRPVAGFFHILIYIGFVLINIEVLEILIDGVAGTHRSLSFLGSIYNTAIGFFEILAVLVFIACVVFLARRFIIKIPRFHSPEMKGWATHDATYILVIEIILMVALLKMNAVDQLLQSRGADHYVAAGSFPVSQFLTGFFSSYDTSTLIVFERVFWWFHILGILFFLNYVPYSKHLHIFLAFPNTWYSRLKPAGEFGNMPEITNEVNLMVTESIVPYGRNYCSLRKSLCAMCVAENFVPFGRNCCSQVNLCALYLLVYVCVYVCVYRYRGSLQSVHMRGRHQIIPVSGLGFRV